MFFIKRPAGFFWTIMVISEEGVSRVKQKDLRQARNNIKGVHSGHNQPSWDIMCLKLLIFRQNVKGQLSDPTKSQNETYRDLNS